MQSAELTSFREESVAACHLGCLRWHSCSICGRGQAQNRDVGDNREHHATEGRDARVHAQAGSAAAEHTWSRS